MSESSSSEATQTTDETSPEAPPDSLVGSTISGRYQIDKLLGEGGMGAVYLAQHTLMHKRVAIKVLHAEMTRMPEVVTRFEREAMAASHMDHPNVAAATDFGKLENGAFFLVLEFVEGKSLRDVLDFGALAVKRALHIGRQIAAALVRAHGLGIVHRDLKPENIMLVERDGDADFVKVLDFGIAKVPVDEIIKGKGAAAKTALTQAGMVYGTPEYMAPEQALGQEIDARADLYALGVMLYEMLTGLRPFESESRVALLGMQVTQQAPTFRERAPDLSIPSSVEALVRSLLEKEAKDRPADARTVHDQLERLVFELGNAPALAQPSGQYRKAALAMTLSQMQSSMGRLATATAAAIKSSNKPSDIVKELRTKVGPALGDVPVILWGMGFAAVAVFGLVFALVLYRANTPRIAKESGSAIASAMPSASAAVPAPPSSATPAMIASASAAGPSAIEALAAQFPKDPEPLVALARNYWTANDVANAMSVYKRLAKEQPEAVQRSEVVDNIVAAASNPKSADLAFGLMESDGNSRRGSALRDRV